LTNGHEIEYKDTRNGYSPANGHGITNGEVKSKIDHEDTTCEQLDTFRGVSEVIERTDAGTRGLVLLPFSGHDDYSIKANISAIGSAVNEHRLSDLAYTLSSRRSRFFQRGFVIVDSENPAARLNLETTTFGKSPNSQIQRIGFIFTGQGAQWAGMGVELFSEYAVFKRSIRYQDAILTKLSVRPTWSIEEVLLMPAATSRIQEAEFSQIICTALQIALVDLLRSWNVHPVATLGHSSGEIAAAYAAGAHTAAEAIVIAYLRGQVVSKSRRDGRMLAAGLGTDDILPYLIGKEAEIKVAAVNSPESVTLSGDVASIQELLPKLEEDKVFARILKTGNIAYHSHHMASLGEEYERLAHQCIDEIACEIAKEKIVRNSAFWQSSVIPYKNRSGYLTSPSYWRQNLESPVLFSQAVKALLENGSVNIDLLVEIGPHPALGGPLKQIRSRLKQESGSSLPTCLPTLKRGENGTRSLLELSGHLFIHNATIDLAAVNAVDLIVENRLQLARGCLCIDLPNYKYHYGPILYHENRMNRELRLRKHLRHDILGARLPGITNGRPAWRNVLRLKDVPWLEDHKVP
jgi:acyl transferase domain-containing protein